MPIVVYEMKERKVYSSVSSSCTPHLTNIPQMSQEKSTLPFAKEMLGSNSK